MFEKLLEKKNMVVNCDVCDARKIQEGDYACYENIVLNADVILVNERSKAILNSLPMIINSDDMIETDDDVKLISANGHYEINGETSMEEKTILCVNGSLVIRPGTEEILKNMVGIHVNGNIHYPESLRFALGKVSLNGHMVQIPDGYVELDADTVIDKYFQYRARQDGKYFAEHSVRLTDPEVNAAALASKNLHFRTGTLVVCEEQAADAVGMFDENVRLQVIPAGYQYVAGDAELNEVLVRKYGTSLYIDGNLKLGSDYEKAAVQLEKLYVNGEVQLLKNQKDIFSSESFRGVDVQYGSMVFVKGKTIANKPFASIDQALLDACPDGIEVINLAALTIKQDVKPETILEKLSIKNCAYLSCSPEQRSSLDLVSENTAVINDGTGDLGETAKQFGSPMDLLKNAVGSRVVNADMHIL